MLTRSLVGAAALGMSMIASAPPAYAQDEDVGKHLYLTSCAICHGESGKGNGPLVVWLTKAPADLTKIQKNNMGVFPFGRVYEVIDGRQAIPGHGPREMPVWGDIYRAEGGESMFGFATPRDVRSYVRGRIVALIGYIYSLQEK